VFDCLNVARECTCTCVCECVFSYVSLRLSAHEEADRIYCTRTFQRMYMLSELRKSYTKSGSFHSLSSPSAQKLGNDFCVLTDNAEWKRGYVSLPAPIPPVSPSRATTVDEARARVMDRLSHLLACTEKVCRSMQSRRRQIPGEWLLVCLRICMWYADVRSVYSTILVKNDYKNAESAHACVAEEGDIACDRSACSCGWVSLHSHSYRHAYTLTQTDKYIK